MTRLKTVRKNKAAEECSENSNPVQAGPAKPQSAAEVLERCRNLALSGLEDITERVIKEAKGGSCQHAKFAFELAEIGARPQVGEKGEEDSLAALLMRELEPPAAAEPEGAA